MASGGHSRATGRRSTLGSSVGGKATLATKDQLAGRAGHQVGSAQFVSAGRVVTMGRHQVRADLVEVRHRKTGAAAFRAGVLGRHVSAGWIYPKKCSEVMLSKKKKEKKKKRKEKRKEKEKRKKRKEREKKEKKEKEKKECIENT